MHFPVDPGQARETLIAGLGRRGFLRAAGAVTAAGGTAAAVAAKGGQAHAATPARSSYTGEILQPHRGRVDGDHYLPSLPDQVRWGYVPALDSEPVLRIRSGQTVTVDSLSHEGLLEDQGRDPVAWFGGHDVPRREVLTDAVAMARDYSRAPRDFDTDGPHVITGPIRVEGAEPGDVLKVEPLSLLPRVPYGVISSRHGKGALARQAGGGAPAGIMPAEVMPAVA
ncbi:acetamidase, partial [Streptomyces klenkii]